MTISFKQYLEESITIKDNKVAFTSEPGDTIILTSFGKGKSMKPFTKKIDDLLSYSLYQAKGKDANEILVALKEANFNDENVQHFLSRSAAYAAKILKDVDADILVSPLSSSDLAKEFMKQIKKRTHHDFYIDAFIKQPDMFKIEIDYDHPKMTDKIAKSMETTIERANRRGKLSVKMFLPMHRKFIKNLFEIADPKLLKKFDGKKVVIIDDIMTTGTSAKNIQHILHNNGATEVNVLTLFKSI